MDRRQWRGDGQGLEDRTAPEVPVSVGLSWAVAPVVGMLGFSLGCLFVRGLGDAAWPEPSVCGGAGTEACTRVFGVFGCL